MAAASLAPAVARSPALINVAHPRCTVPRRATPARVHGSSVAHADRRAPWAQGNKKRNQGPSHRSRGLVVRAEAPASSDRGQDTSSSGATSLAPSPDSPPALSQTPLDVASFSTAASAGLSPADSFSALEPPPWSPLPGEAPPDAPPHLRAGDSAGPSAAWGSLAPDAASLGLNGGYPAEGLLGSRRGSSGIGPDASGVVEIPIPGARPPGPDPEGPGSPGLGFPVVLLGLDAGLGAASELASLAPSEQDLRSLGSSGQWELGSAAPVDGQTEDSSGERKASRDASLASSVEELLRSSGTTMEASVLSPAVADRGSPPYDHASDRSSLAGALAVAPTATATELLPAKEEESQGLLHTLQRRWEQSGAGPRVKSILGFAGPAIGIWLCSPLMSLIDTAVVGSGSSLELAALGPGTIVVDNLAFLYMFLSIATGNLIATSMAEQKPEEASGHLQRLLLVALVCGAGMVAFSELCAGSLISGLAGQNTSIVPAACQYAKIRGLAWPAVLITSVTQSASLALQDSWTPLLCLSVASGINLFGDIVLCRVFNLGIAGAAWATMASQYAACVLMLVTIARGSRLNLGISIPSAEELLYFMSLAGPIFMSLVAKVGFYTLVTYMATSLGTVSLAAHQVVIGIFAVCAVCAEPLSQTAQAFLPRLCVGAERNLQEAKALIQTLGVVALVLGVIEALVASAVSVTMPSMFTSDPAIAGMMRSLVVPLGVSLLLNPVVLAAEGVLLAARDVRFLATAMMTNMAVCGGLLLAAGHFRLGLEVNWWIVGLFQIVRIAQACARIWSPYGIIRQAELHAD